MAITDLDPRLLVEAHNAGNDEAFALIVQAHHQSLFAHAVTRLHDVQAAEDAVQETFVRAYRAMPRFQGDFHLRAWLHRILTNVCHDEGARRQRDGRLVERVSSQAAVDAAPADLDVERMDVSRDAVADALATLPESYREALVLRYVQELSYEQVAAATGVTEGNARIRVMRGRAALKRALTSSHAIVIAVVPWLRRGGRGVVPDLPSLGSTAVASASSVAGSPSVLANAPMLLRAMDTAPQVAERAASIPQVIGVIAAMAVPLAVPAVGDRVAGWTGDRPPAAVAPASPDLVAGSTGGEAVGGVPTSAPDATTTTAATASDPSAGAATAAAAAAPTETTPTTATTAAPSTTTSVSTAPSTSTSAPAPTSTVPTTAAPSTASPPAGTPAPPPPPAAPGVPVTLNLALAGRQVTAVGDPRTELAGTVSWRSGTASATGQLRGTLAFHRPAVTEEPAAEGDGAPVAAGAPDADVTPASEPRRFSGDLTLALDDGRLYVLRLTDGILDGPDTGTSAAAGFELVDRCGGVVASGSLTGSLDLQQAPVPSSLELALVGEGPAEAPACG